MSASHSKVVVDHEGDLSSSWKPVLFPGFLFLKSDPFLDLVILDDLVQCRCNSRVHHLKIREILTLNLRDSFPYNTVAPKCGPPTRWAQNHFLWTTVGLECAEKTRSILQSIPSTLSGGATTLIHIVDGANAVNSFAHKFLGTWSFHLTTIFPCRPNSWRYRAQWDTSTSTRRDCSAPRHRQKCPSGPHRPWCLASWACRQSKESQRIVTSKTSLAHANAVVDDERDTSCSAMFCRNERKESMWVIYIPLMVICCATRNSTCTKLWHVFQLTEIWITTVVDIFLVGYARFRNMDCGRDNERRKVLSERKCSYITKPRKNEEHQMTERGRKKGGWEERTSEPRRARWARSGTYTYCLRLQHTAERNPLLSRQMIAKFN